MITILHNARKNMGDFLIRERGLRLLPAGAVLNAWEPLTRENINFANQCDSIVILGGPLLQPRFYPELVRLTDDLDRIKAPIVLFGVGAWTYPPELETYKFSDQCRKLLDKVSAIGTRDDLSRRLLSDNGYSSLTIGCPALQDSKGTGKRIQEPEEVQNICISPPADNKYRPQAAQLVAMVREMFPTASLHFSFNRGFWSGADMRPYQQAGVCYNGSFKTELDIYDKCDLHIGYRVHSHLWFLARRKPSYLLHEDGRGQGQTELLVTEGVDAWDGFALHDLRDTIEWDLENNYGSLEHVPGIIDELGEITEEFIAEEVL